MKKYILMICLFSFLIISCNANKSYNNSEDKKETADNNFNNFVFVGMINNNPGIYRYDVNQEKYFPVWQRRNEKVVELSYSEDRKAAFFITATSKGKRGVFPFIKNVKVYLINPDSGNAKYLANLKNGMQVFTSWESGSTFKVTLNSIDKTIADQVNQHNIIFNIDGKKELDETKKYDIVKDGYPIPSVHEDEKVNNDYEIDTTLDDLTSIFLVDKTSKDTIPITSIEQKLNKYEWTDNGNYLIFTTKDVTPGNETLYDENPKTSKLFVYSTKDKSIKKVFEGSGIKNFFIINNWVIFDDGFKDKSTIKIYNFIDLQLIKEIKIKGGCGLRNIPEIPDYSA